MEIGPMLGVGEAPFSGSSWSSKRGKLAKPSQDRRWRVRRIEYKVKEQNASDGLAAVRGLKFEAEDLERTS